MPLLLQESKVVNFTVRSADASWCEWSSAVKRDLIAALNPRANHWNRVKNTVILMKQDNTNMLSLFIVALFGMTLSAKGAPMFNTSFANFDGMVKREPWKQNPGVPPQPVDWQKILTVNDLYAVVGNQAVLHMGPPAKGSAIFASPLGVSKADHSSVSTTGPVQPGLEVLQFFPLAVSQGEFHQMSAMPAILSFQDASGGTLAAENEVARRVWRPDVQTGPPARRSMLSGNGSGPSDFPTCISTWWHGENRCFRARR